MRRAVLPERKKTTAYDQARGPGELSLPSSLLFLACILTNRDDRILASLPKISPNCQDNLPFIGHRRAGDLRADYRIDSPLHLAVIGRQTVEMPIE